MSARRLIVRQMELGPMANFVYIIGCGETGEAAVVDPAWDIPAITRAAEQAQLNIRHALLTHGHPDHMNGVEELLAETDAFVHMHADEVDYMRQVADIFAMRVDFLERQPGNSRTLGDGARIDVGNLAVQIIHTPGHTPGSQCFHVEGSLFSGDTLFVNACGRVDLPGSDPEKMWWSLNRRLRELPDETVLYPGHNYSERTTSTIGDEKRSNPYMRIDTPERFLRVMSIY